MIETFLRTMRYVPLVTLPFVFWQLGNRQIFDNELLDMTTLNTPKRSGHTIVQSLLSLKISSPELPPILFFSAYLVFFIIMKV